MSARWRACSAPALTVVAVVLAALGSFGLFEPSFLVAVFALVVGMTLYEAAFEVARTLLNARGAALAMILRTVLMVLFGSVSSLARRRRARARPCHCGRPCRWPPRRRWRPFHGLRWAHGSRAASFHIVTYGWPLLLSFGVTAVGQSIDRLLLAHYLGPATLGPYGVVADMLRQSFTVLGDAIIAVAGHGGEEPRQ